MWEEEGGGEVEEEEQEKEEEEEEEEEEEKEETHTLPFLPHLLSGSQSPHSSGHVFIPIAYLGKHGFPSAWWSVH